MPITLRRRGLLAVALAASCPGLLAATPASAKVKIPKAPQVAAYNVEFTGSGGYDLTSTGSSSTNTIKSQFHWDVKYKKMFFIRKAGSPVSTIVDPKKSTSGGDWSVTLTTPDPDSDCAAAGSLEPGSAGGIDGAVQKSGKVSFAVTIGSPAFITQGGDSGSTACSTMDFWHDFLQSAAHIGNFGDVPDTDPITAFSILDTADFKLGKIVDNVSNVTLRNPSLNPASDCSSGPNGDACTQQFAWHGHLILTKTKP